MIKVTLEFSNMEELNAWVSHQASAEPASAKPRSPAKVVAPAPSPVAPAPAPSPAPSPAPAPAPAPAPVAPAPAEATSVSLLDVQQVITQAVGKLGTAKTRELLSQFGATNATNIKPEHYNAFYTACADAINA
jgi:hypothetical protein